MGRNIPTENFLGGNFPGGIFQRGSLMGGNFLQGISPGRIFLEPFSSYNVSILIFQKIIKKYNKTFNKKIYTLNWENVAYNFFPTTFCFNVREIFLTQSG